MTDTGGDLLSSHTQEKTFQVPKADSPHLAHVVGPEMGGQGRDGASLAMQARVHGLPLMTLCRRVLVPSRDPRRLPMCGVCEALVEERIGEQALGQVPYA